VSGDAYRAAPELIGAPLPTSLDAALEALETDALLCEGLGEEIVSTFLAMKRFELERHRSWVSDWEIAEYLHHL
jgi:glutamine synthetase